MPEPHLHWFGRVSIAVMAGPVIGGGCVFIACLDLQQPVSPEKKRCQDDLFGPMKIILTPVF